jgi:protein-disulfide isomerase
LSFGPKDGPIQVVQFLDYESQFSPKGAANVRTQAAKYPSHLHFVLHQYPLPDNRHAHLAAQAALAAQAQGKYWPMHDKLLENRTQLERADLLRYAKELGLDVAKFTRALDNKTYASAVDADIALGKALQVVGMPTIFVNNERILNSVDEEGIIAAVEEYLARGAKPSANGI